MKLFLSIVLAMPTLFAQQVINGDRVMVGTVNYCADAGSNDTYACTITGLTAYGTGVSYSFKANTANTGAATINFTSLGAKTIVKVEGGVTTALADNDIRAGQIVDLKYDGTNMQMQSTKGNAAAAGGGAAPEFGTVAAIRATTCASASDKRAGFPTSGLVGYGLVCNGTAWLPVLFGRALSAFPTDPGTAWNNTDCSAVDTTDGVVYFQCTTTDTSMHGRMQSVSTSGNWAYAIAYSAFCHGTDCKAGVYARNTSDTKFRGLGLGNSGTASMWIARSLSGTNNSTTAEEAQNTVPVGPLQYACIGDAGPGSAMTSYYSVDGLHWKAVDATMRSAGSVVLSSGANQVGFVISNSSNGLGAITVWASKLTTSASTCPSL